MQLLDDEVGERLDAAMMRNVEKPQQNRLVGALRKADVECRQPGQKQAPAGNRGCGKGRPGCQSSVHATEVNRRLAPIYSIFRRRFRGCV